jgi:Holliday junction resolvasome RuvABC endonuclease subunit
MNCILGLDISTSITGVTVLDKNSNLLYNEFWDTRNKNKFPSLYSKADLITNKLIEIKKRFKIDKIGVEQSLHTFRSGFSSAQTLSKLSRFNGMICLVCYQTFKIKPTLISASSARKSVGIKVKRGENAKEKSFNFVLDIEPSFVVEYTRNGNIKPGILDKSDSYVIAKATLLN